MSWIASPSSARPRSTSDGSRELSAAGVDQFNLYLMSGDEEAQLESYGSTVIPALKAALDDA